MSTIQRVFFTKYGNIVLYISFWKFPIYSTRNFICRGHFPVFLIEILLKIEFQWQFWILLVLRIPKHPQKVEFDKDLAELLKVKHNTSHMKNFQLFSQQQNFQ